MLKKTALFLREGFPKFGTKKSLGTGLEKIEYQKKYRNQSRKISVLKKSWNRARKNLIPKKCLGIIKILGLVTPDWNQQYYYCSLLMQGY